MVYVCRHGENPELKYSLRTLKNVRHGKVWIFGGAPVWVSDEVTHRVRPQTGSPYSATRGHIAAACNTPEVSDPFMLWNDDFYAMQPVAPMAVYHRGPLVEMLEQFADTKTLWAKGLRETAAMIGPAMETTVMSYDTHLPLIIHKAPMLEALRWAAKARGDAIHVRTLYGVVADLRGSHHPDPKLMKKTHPFPTGAWLSSGDDTFRSTVEPVLRYLFPDPSPYERGPR